MVTTSNKNNPESETTNNIVCLSDLFAGDSYDQIRQYHKQPDFFDMRVYRSPIWDNPSTEKIDELYKEIYADPQKAWEDSFNKS